MKVALRSTGWIIEAGMDVGNGGRVKLFTDAVMLPKLEGGTHQQHLN